MKIRNNRKRSGNNESKISAIYTRRVARQYAICWLKKELSMVHGTLHIFFRNKTFLFVKIESWNFQQLFDLGFRETLQNFSSFRQTFRWHFCMGNKDLSKLADIFWGFTKSLIIKMLKISAFYLDKQKSFVPNATFCVTWDCCE